jgi:hypothetical protein
MLQRGILARRIRIAALFLAVFPGYFCSFDRRLPEIAAAIPHFQPTGDSTDAPPPADIFGRGDFDPNSDAPHPYGPLPTAYLRRKFAEYTTITRGFTENNRAQTTPFFLRRVSTVCRNPP